MSEDSKAQSKLNKIMDILGGKEPEYAMKEDLEILKEDIASAFKSDEFKSTIKDIVNECVVEALQKPGFKEDKPEEKENEEEEKKPQDESQSEEENKPEETNPKKEDEEEEEKPATKEDSKRLPLHDGAKPAMKSDSAIVMEIMGRDLGGRPKQ